MTWRLPSSRGSGALSPLQGKGWGLLPPADSCRYTLLLNSCSEVFQKEAHLKDTVEKRGCLCLFGLERSLKCIRAFAWRSWGRPRGGSFSAVSGISRLLHEACFPHQACNIIYFISQGLPISPEKQASAKSGFQRNCVRIPCPLAAGCIAD